MLQEPRSQGVTFPGASTAPQGWSTRHSRSEGKNMRRRYTLFYFSACGQERGARRGRGWGRERPGTLLRSPSAWVRSSPGRRGPDNSQTLTATQVSPLTSFDALTVPSKSSYVLTFLPQPQPGPFPDALTSSAQSPDIL